jgi:hypothetical protein
MTKEMVQLEMTRPQVQPLVLESRVAPYQAGRQHRLQEQNDGQRCPADNERIPPAVRAPRSVRSPPATTRTGSWVAAGRVAVDGFVSPHRMSVIALPARGRVILTIPMPGQVTLVPGRCRAHR